MCGIVPHMAKSISISDRLYTLCRDEASVQNRSIAQQLEHWVMLARHGGGDRSSSEWDQLQAFLQNEKEKDRERILSGKMDNKNVSVFASFDVRRDITIHHKKI